MTSTKIGHDYEQKLRGITQENEQLSRRLHQYDTKLNYANKQIQRLNSVIRSKVEEGNSYDSKVRSLFDQNENLNRRLQELTVANRKISEYDGKITILSQEIERLNMTLKTKLGEIHNLEEKCRNR